MYNINPDRAKDDSQENVINTFLVPHYFKKVFTNVRPVDDTDMQGKGVDFKCDSNTTKDMLVDVKAMSSKKYINDPRPTYSLEVSTYNRNGDEITGWFFSAESMTEYYTFVWIHDAKVDSNGRIRTAEDINKVEVMTVDAHALQDYIDDVLYDNDMDDIFQIAQSMRWREEQKITVCPGICWRHSSHLPEKPVNLVVHKDILQRFALSGIAGHCWVTKDGVKEIYRRV
ncbi:MAG: hypothetical protein IJZ68_06015 [Bacteroidaceae bacterium]|nr:hypothetical protein [Bacteroidaceae bacterium]